MPTKANCSQGFTLIELQVANLLGLLLIFLLLTTFTLLLQQYKLVHAVNTLQINALMAKELLHRQLRMAGFIGCANVKDIDIKVQQVSFQPSLTNSIFGFSAASPVASLYRLPKAKLHSDIILSWHRANRANASEKYNKSHGFWLLSTCRYAKLMPYGLKSPLPANADLAPFHYYAYYIRPCKAISHTCYGLYRKSLLQPASPAQELVSGISKMKVHYGIKNSKGKLIFKSAAAVQDWSQVRVLKIELLLMSLEPVLTKPQHYWFNNSWHRASDHLLRRSLVTYVYLRQR